MKPIKVVLFSVFCAFQFMCKASEPVAQNQLKFIKNLNQFHPNALYLAEMNGGAVFLERSTFTYVFYNETDLDKVDHYLHNCEYLDPTKELPVLRGHAYKMHLEGANENPVITESGKCKEYYNYFFGQDQSKWAGNVPLFNQVYYNNVYPGIDLKVYSEADKPKYDFVVRPGAYINDIVLNFEGTDGLCIQDGNLKINTSVGTIIEQQPYAYQLINGEKRSVPCAYALKNEYVTFRFPEGYNHNYELVIDPVIIAATYSGTTYRAYAHTAAYDHSGNIYSSGRAFSPNVNGSGAGYPATTGAFQTTHHGGYQDICVSKYNPDGSSLIWATYIGGSEQEQPHSLFVNANNELYIYGTSNSPNYPVSATGYQKTNPTDNFGNHLSDIIVTKLNSTGSGIIGSTYVGGRTEDDGKSVTSVQRYYGDDFKGQIVVDSLGNAYVASYTQATDFPTTAGAFQTAYSGGDQDGVVFKLNNDLSSLVWSTFYGGPADDACYALKLDASGDLFVTGAISSNILTNTAGTYHSNYQGGLFDAFVSHIRADGQAVLKSTYFGTNSEEQAYLLDLDKDGNVYIFGTSPTNSIQPTPGAYQAALGGSFIAKLKPTLDSVRFITVFNQIAPTALMVDECDYIYAVGHGGLGNTIAPLSGFATTAGAFQTGSGGFYMMTLEPDAIALKFGSYYGPQDSHVDGGTCRFDKRGIIYHALCTDKTTMFTTANAFHTTKLSNDFDNTVFKIDFQAGRVEAEALATVQGSIDTSTLVGSCNHPLSIQFINHSLNAVQYTWYFGTGDSSTLTQPAYTYTDTGSYMVTLVARDPASCNKTDTAFVAVNIHSLNTSLTHTDAGCSTANGSATANIISGPGPFTYAWSNNGNTQTISSLNAGTYTVTVTGAGGCSVTSSVTVSSLNGVTLTASATNTTCNSSTGSATVSVTAGNSPFSYLWSNGATTASISNLPSGNYTVTVTGGGNCTATASATVISSNGVTLTPASVNTTCGNNNGTAGVTASTGLAPFSYAWSNFATTSSLSNLPSGTYTVTVTDANTCSATASIVVGASSVSPANITSDKTIMCSGDTAHICITGTFASYIWNQGQTTQCINTKLAGNYYVTVTDNAGCTVASNHLAINVHPLPPVSISVNGDTLTAYNAVSYQWFLNNNPINDATGGEYIAHQSGSYSVAVTDSNGCHAVSNPIAFVQTGVVELTGGVVLSVFPNPFEENCELQIFNCEFKQPLQLELFDAIGRKVLGQKIISSNTKLNLESLAKGVYLLKVSDKKLLVTQKISKE